jgi:hypothetical protein
MARMPRKPRLHVDGAFYHLILRGIIGRTSPSRAEDRVRSSDRIADVIERFRLRVHAYSPKHSTTTADSVIEIEVGIHDLDSYLSACICNCSRANLMNRNASIPH